MISSSHSLWDRPALIAPLITSAPRDSPHLSLYHGTARPPTRLPRLAEPPPEQRRPTPQLPPGWMRFCFTHASHATGVGDRETISLPPRFRGGGAGGAPASLRPRRLLLALAVLAACFGAAPRGVDASRSLGVWGAKAADICAARRPRRRRWACPRRRAGRHPCRAAQVLACGGRRGLVPVLVGENDEHGGKASKPSPPPLLEPLLQSCTLDSTEQYNNDDASLWVDGWKTRKLPKRTATCSSALTPPSGLLEAVGLDNVAITKGFFNGASTFSTHPHGSCSCEGYQLRIIFGTRRAFSAFGDKGKFLSGGNYALAKLWDWSKGFSS